MGTYGQVIIVCTGVALTDSRIHGRASQITSFNEPPEPKPYTIGRVEQCVQIAKMS